MNLVYLKLAEYKCLRNVEIIFSSSYKLEQGKKLEKVACIKLNTYGAFDNITAFVGENGVGKSTLLEAISLLISGQGDFIKGTLVVEVGEKLFFIGEDISLINNKLKIKPLEFGFFLGREAAQVIYYSPIYSPHTELIRTRHNFKNVSNDSVYKYSKLKNREADLAMQFDFFNNMPEFAKNNLKFERYLEIGLTKIDYSNIYRKIIHLVEAGHDSRRDSEVHDFVNEFVLKNDLFLHEGFSLPLISNIDDEDTQHKVRQFHKNLKQRINVIEERVNRLAKRFSLESQAEFHFILNFMITTIKDRFYRRREYEQNLLMLDHFLKLAHEDDLRKWMLNFEKILNDSENKMLFKFEGWNSDMRKLLELFSDHMDQGFPIRFSTDQSFFALNIISKLRTEGLLKYGLEVQWRGISSGQIAKINLFSRLFERLKKIGQGKVLIVLDEADIYLHPEWQRKFLYELSEFLSAHREIHKGDISYDLLISTHSPLMISDLLKENVFIVKKGQSNRSHIEQAQNETLGANIHQLYREEFVMTYPRGELANIFIKDIFAKLEKGVADPDFVRFAASKIGEVILSTGMLNALRKDDKFKSN